MPEGACLNADQRDDDIACGPCSPATVEEAQDRMLHPERYEAAAQVLTLTPSGDTEFNTAQQAGSTGASLPGADEDQDLPYSRKGTLSEQVVTEELWDESFKAPTTLTLQRSNSPTSTLADRFISAGMYESLRMPRNHLRSGHYRVCGPRRIPGHGAQGCCQGDLASF